MIKNKLPLIAFCAASLPAACFADFIGFEVGVGVWNHSPSGTMELESGGSNEADLEDDFNFDSETDLVFWAALEHPIPVIPNIKIKSTGLSHEGDGTIEGSLNFGDVVFTGSENVEATMELDQLDATLYYEILDNWVNIDLGLTARKVSGKIEVREDDGSQFEAENFDVVIPMIYGTARFDLPFSGFRVGVEGNLVSFDGNKFADFSVMGGYESDLGLGAQLGYRIEDIVLDDVDGVSADIRVGGVMANVYYHF